METSATIQGRLQQIIDATGLSDRALGDLAGLRSPAHVGMILRGDVTVPKGPTLAAIAKGVGVAAGWLTFGEGDAPDEAALRAIGEAHKAKRRDNAGTDDGQAA